MVLAGLLLIPAAVGALAGWILRKTLARSTFSQRDYFRSWLIQILIVFSTIAIGLIEGRHDGMPPVTIVTTRSISAPPWAVWNSISFTSR